MKSAEYRAYLLPLALLAYVPVSQGQTATLLSHSVILSNPPDKTHYEKAIGNFTSTSYPSYFLGTSSNGYIYDIQTGQNCTLGDPAEYYERARPFTYQGDKYAGVVASLYTSVAWLQNPTNWGGSSCQPWPEQSINPSRGAHQLHLVDLDGDGKLDLLASGAQYPVNLPKGFLAFQNSSSSWPLGTFVPAAGDDIDVVSISGVNGGARTNIVSCNPNNNSLYWYQNPGGRAARGTGWTTHLLASTSVNGHSACTQGVAIATLNVGNRDIVIVASGEAGDSEAWAPGLGYYDPGSNPMGTWSFHQIDSSYLDVHQIATDILNGTAFFTVGEQEQASSICNGYGFNDHGSSYSGCRVAIFAWNGSSFNAPTIVSNLGSHNQTLYQLNGVEYMAGANHDEYEAVDRAYNLWTFNFNSTRSGGGGSLATGMVYNFKDASGLTMDLGWALNPQWVDGVYIYLYSYNNDPSQQIIYTGSGQLQPAQNSGEYLCNDGGALGLGTSGDTFTIAASGSGYTIYDNNAKLYVNTPGKIDPPNKLTLSPTPTVWTAVLQ